MSQGTVKVTPRPPSPGQVVITNAEDNGYGVENGATLSFPDPGFPVNDGDNVECTITSASECNVNSVMQYSK